MEARARKGKIRPRGVSGRLFLPAWSAARGARHAAKLARFGGILMALMQTVVVPLLPDLPG
ncbi:hypothetical protein GCM10010313_28650 [Streptomyces violarus]|nr:hypothetical protein GCM10010313_28650 [Streptomyces violarus]